MECLDLFPAESVLCQNVVRIRAEKGRALLNDGRGQAELHGIAHGFVGADTVIDDIEQHVSGLQLGIVHQLGDGIDRGAGNVAGIEDLCQLCLCLFLEVLLQDRGDDVIVLQTQVIGGKTLVLEEVLPADAVAEALPLPAGTGCETDGKISVLAEVDIVKSTILIPSNSFIPISSIFVCIVFCFSVSVVI